MAELEAHRFTEHANHAIDLLRRDSPSHFERAKAALAGSRVTLRVRGWPALELGLEHQPWLRRGNAGAVVEVALGADLLMQLLRGDRSIERAVDDGTLNLKGDLVHLASFLSALKAWLHGALRCPSLAWAHAAYLAHPS